MKCTNIAKIKYYAVLACVLLIRLGIFTVQKIPVAFMYFGLRKRYGMCFTFMSLHLFITLFIAGDFIPIATATAGIQPLNIFSRLFQELFHSLYPLLPPLILKFSLMVLWVLLHDITKDHVTSKELAYLITVHVTFQAL